MDLSTNKKIIFSGIALFFLVFGAVFWYLKDRPTPIAPTEQQQQQVTDPNQLPPAERSAFAESAITKKQSEKLEGFHYEPLTKESCSGKAGDDKNKCDNLLLADQALQKNDLSYCQEISTAAEQSYCVMKFVRQKPDIKNCELIKTEFGKESCINFVAFATNDKKICNNNETEFARKECAGPIMAYNTAALGDLAGCKKIDVLEYGSLCIQRIMNDLNNDCTKFKEKEDQVYCEDVILYENALDMNNPKPCALISDKVRKQVCENVMAKGKEVDTDNDRVSDNKELWFLTDPFKADTDDDGINDGDEIKKYYTDPSEKDTDEDGLNDGDEVRNMINPNGKGDLDTDGDGLSDKQEIANKTDIDKMDTDLDGLSDHEEVDIYKTDPLKPDTDGDGFKDGDEVRRGFNPAGAGKLQITKPAIK
jgi:hypothetical protein